MQPQRLDDPENKWKGYLLFKDYIINVYNNDLFTPEMVADYKKLKWISIASLYIAPGVGFLFGIMVINPIYLGRGSRVLRKIVPIISAYFSYNCANNIFERTKTELFMKYYDHFPPHMRQFLHRWDHRLLLELDPDFKKYTVFDENKKSIF